MTTAPTFQGIELEPIEWKFLPESPYPDNAEIQGLTFKEKYILLRQASEEFDRLKFQYSNLNLDALTSETLGASLPVSSGYTDIWRSGEEPYSGVLGYSSTFESMFPVTADGNLPYPSTQRNRGYMKPKLFDVFSDGFTDQDLPSTGLFTHQQYQQALVGLSDSVSRLRGLKWPALAYSPECGMGLYQNPDTQEVDQHWMVNPWRPGGMQTLPFPLIEVRRNPDNPESEMRPAYYLDFFADTLPAESMAELFYKLMMQEHHYVTEMYDYNDGLHGYAGGPRLFHLGTYRQGSDYLPFCP
jgi:hypothetical protein